MLLYNAPDFDTEEEMTGTDESVSILSETELMRLDAADFEYKRCVEDRIGRRGDGV